MYVLLSIGQDVEELSGYDVCIIAKSTCLVSLHTTYNPEYFNYTDLKYVGIFFPSD